MHFPAVQVDEYVIIFSSGRNTLVTQRELFINLAKRRGQSGRIFIFKSNDISSSFE